MHAFKRMAAAAALAAAVLALPTALSAQGTVYDVSQLTEKPRIASPMAAQRHIQSSYPRSLQSAGVEGKVMVQFVVGPDGKVDPSTIQVQSTDDDRLADAAKKAVAKIEFVPGQVDGSPVSTRVVFPISYVAQ